MNNLPKWETYGNYKSENYGAHALKFTFPDGREIYFSYKTPVAFVRRGGSPVVRENDWGPTTGKHLNAIDGGHKSARFAGDVFEDLLAAEFGG
jgi:hypothetical protein